MRLVLDDGRVDFDRSRTVRRTSRCCGCRCSIIADLPLRVAQISHMERRSRRGGKLLWRRMLGQRVQLTRKRSRVANSATRGVTRPRPAILIRVEVRCRRPRVRFQFTLRVQPVVPARVVRTVSCSSAATEKNFKIVQVELYETTTVLTVRSHPIGQGVWLR